MQDGLMPYLVVEKRNNDYAFIDISIFNAATYQSFSSLDNILKNYTEEEIKDIIIKANIVPDVDIKDKRLLIKYGNYKLPIYTKDISESFNIYDYIRDNFDSKEKKNLFYNKIASFFKNDENAEEKKATFKYIIDYGTVDDFYRSLDMLDYVEFRELYFYIYNYIAKKQEIRDNRLKREKE